MQEIALACTGGGVKSAINIGVIRGLEELGIRITAISGASLGSCVAILYAMGYSPKEILKIYSENMEDFSKFTIKDILCAVPNLMFRGGLKNPKTIEKSVIRNCTNGIVKMSDFNIPVIIPSMDITQRKTIYYSSKQLKEFPYYTERNVSEAIRSSCSFPIVFIPNKVKIDDKFHHLMDGGITTNTPVVPLKQFSNFVIGLETKYKGIKEREKINFFTMFTEGFQSMRRSALLYQKREADLWIEIDVEKTKVFDSIKALEYCEELGYKAIKEIFNKNEIKELEMRENNVFHYKENNNFCSM